MNPKEELESLRKAAVAIAKKAIAEKRDLTPAEQTDLDAKMARMEELRSHIEAGEKSAATFAALDAMAAERDGNFIDGEKRFLSFSKAWSNKVVDESSPYGQKALATGSSVFVDAELTTTPIVMGKPVSTLLNVIPVTRHSQPAYSYLRQSVRTNNAAVVAEGATKPTSVYTLIKVDGALSVIAHLSEAVPRYWFEDRNELQQFINTEMAYGLHLAVESKVLADINATSGIQLQAYDTSKLVTIRKSLTKVELQGYTPSAILIHPLDWQDIELLLVTTGAVDVNGLPYDAATRRLWGTPVVVANVEAQGEAHVLAEGAVGLDTDSGRIGMQWSETSNADDFAKNFVRARMEGRFGSSVFRPLGVVKADLTA